MTKVPSDLHNFQHLTSQLCNWYGVLFNPNGNLEHIFFTYKWLNVSRILQTQIGYHEPFCWKILMFIRKVFHASCVDSPITGSKWNWPYLVSDLEKPEHFRGKLPTTKRLKLFWKFQYMKRKSTAPCSYHFYSLNVLVGSFPPRIIKIRFYKFPQKYLLLWNLVVLWGNIVQFFLRIK